MKLELFERSFKNTLMIRSVCNTLLLILQTEMSLFKIFGKKKSSIKLINEKPQTQYDFDARIEYYKFTEYHMGDHSTLRSFNKLLDKFNQMNREEDPDLYVETAANLIAFCLILRKEFKKSPERQQEFAVHESKLRTQAQQVLSVI